MTPHFIFIILFVAMAQLSFAQAGKDPNHRGPSNVGREYGNPSMPMFVSHLPKKNQAMLARGSSPRHNMFTRLLCFKRKCRIQVGHKKSLHAVSYEKFKKKIKKNGDVSKQTPSDSVSGKVKPKVVPQRPKKVIDTVKAPAIVEAPVLKEDSVIVLGGELLFATNSSKLSSDHFPTLNSIVDFLSDHPRLTVRISGHTDNTGNESHNKKLSTQRADVVAEYLVDNGIDIDRVSSIGLGSSSPIALNTTVELLIHDPR
ncbi:MAG: OmpA family protein [Cyclobacteriaceae bacterium]|nr:OmpA family protein [Cyclobacteriaceae bacterium]